MHWAPTGRTWTTVPGTRIETARTNWVKKTIDLGSATGLQATFNNGSGTWDNNGGRNYQLPAGNVAVRDGQVVQGDPRLPGTDPDPGDKQAKVFYATGSWSAANIHYRPDSGS
ncbi:carbohydrate binding domain-containing protein [Streptomyces sp. NPDC005336]|uniref:carbohydrate binding domain-containing protein n=1 Tax=Streptomyces sp. NPDC005336 TaxID=3157035 RepID=UPI0033B2247B